MTLVGNELDRKRHGKHYTPSALADFLAKRTLAKFDNPTRLTIMDPSCGDGELLLAAHRVAAELGLDAELELIGFDLDPVAIAIAVERAAAANVPIRVAPADFLEVSQSLFDRPVDAVITNPPYVRTQQLGHELARKLSEQFGLKGRVDLTHPFVAVMPKVLRPGGVLGLLCSNRFMTTKAGMNVRRILQTNLTPLEVFDLGDTRIFEAAVLPAIVIAANEQAAEETNCPFSSAYEVRELSTAQVSVGTSLFDGLAEASDSTVLVDGRTISIRSGRLSHASSSTDPWRLSHSAGDSWLSRIRAGTWRTFGEIAKIRVGIKSTADAVFIGKDWEVRNPQPEQDLLLPLITHDDVVAWRVNLANASRVLYPYDLTKPKRTLLDMQSFPRAMSYLESHAERLRGREYVTKAGRQWFEIWVPQRPADWAAPKIVFPDISVEAQFALDDSGAVVNGDCYWISVKDIGSEDLGLLMLAVANSSTGQRYYDEVCGNKLYSGRRRWMTQYVARLPVPDPNLAESNRIVDLARELVKSELGHPSLLAEIDDLVEAAFVAGDSTLTQASPMPDTLF